MTLRAALLLPVALLVSPLHAQPGAGTWSLLEDSPFDSYRFEDGHFIDPNTGWVVNGDGEVWKTDDGGDSWDQLGDYQQLYIRSVAFPTAELGFFGTLWSDGPLWRTTDGGLTFENTTDRIEGPAPEGICGLQALSEDVVVGVGWFAGPSHFIKTTDGGETWTSRDLTSIVGSLVDLYFWDEQRGLIVGGSNALQSGGGARVALTEDGGETWTVVYTTDPPAANAAEWAWKVSFPTPTTGYVAVEYGGGGVRPAKVLKTEDAGLTWSELTIPGSLESAGLQGVGFMTEEVGWASGRGTTSVTVDGGQTWETIGLDGSVNRFEFFGDTLAYAMGQRIYKLDRLPTSTEQPAETASFALDAAYPNPTSGALSVRYRLRSPATVDLTLIDLLGRRVATLEEGYRSGGEHEAAWDGQGDRGAVAPGLYLLRLRAGDQVATRRVTVLGR